MRIITTILLFLLSYCCEAQLKGRYMFSTGFDSYSFTFAKNGTFKYQKNSCTYTNNGKGTYTVNKRILIITSFNSDLPHVSVSKYYIPTDIVNTIISFNIRDIDIGTKVFVDDRLVYQKEQVSNKDSTVELLYTIGSVKTLKIIYRTTYSTDTIEKNIDDTFFNHVVITNPNKDLLKSVNFDTSWVFEKNIIYMPVNMYGYPPVLKLVKQKGRK